MKVQVNSKEFKTALTKLALLPGAKDRTVLCRAETDGLYLEAAAGGAFLSVRLDAEVTETGVLATDGEALGGLSTPTKQLTLSSVGRDKLAFQSGGLRGTTAQFQDDRLASIEAQRPVANAACTVRINVPAFLRALNAVRIIPAVTGNTHGTRVTLTPEMLMTGCSDIYRAALFRVPMTDIHSGEMDFFADTGFLQTLLTYADTDEAQMVVQGGLLHVESGNVSANIPLLQQRGGPNQIAQVVDALDRSECLGAARLDIKDLQLCLTSTNSIVGTKSYDSRLRISRTGKTISMTAESPRGSATSEHELAEEPENAVPNDFNVVVSIRYLGELIDLFPSDVVDIYVWENIVELRSTDGQYSSVMPTVIA